MKSEQVVKFVAYNKFPITIDNLQSRCVDGRPALGEITEKLPAISKPGADVGDLMVTLGALNFLGLTLSPHEALAVILDTLGGSTNFKFHTDSHAEQKQTGKGMGCGHINRATMDPHDYNLTKEQTDFIVDMLPNLLEEGAKQVVLEGDHAEQAVLVIDSEHYGVKPYLKLENEEIQAFIYQQTLHRQQLDKLAKPLAEKISASGQQIDEPTMREAIEGVFQKQLGATLQRIAKGLPVYNVQIDEPGEIKVQAMSH